MSARSFEVVHHVWDFSDASWTEHVRARVRGARFGEVIARVLAKKAAGMWETRFGVRARDMMQVRRGPDVVFSHPGVIVQSVGERGVW